MEHREIKELELDERKMRMFVHYLQSEGKKVRDLEEYAQKKEAMWVKVLLASLFVYVLHFIFDFGVWVGVGLWILFAVSFYQAIQWGSKKGKLRGYVGGIVDALDTLVVIGTTGSEQDLLLEVFETIFGKDK